MSMEGIMVTYPCVGLLIAAVVRVVTEDDRYWGGEKTVLSFFFWPITLLIGIIEVASIMIAPTVRKVKGRYFNE